MTNEEILAMKASRELDVLVASKIFGIEVEWDYPPWDINRMLPKLPFRKGEPQTALGPMVHPVANIIYKYSTDISAAWPVMKKFPGMKVAFLDTLRPSVIEESPTLKKLPDGRLEWFVVQYEDYTVRAQEAPEAICKAALLAKLEEPLNVI